MTIEEKKHILLVEDSPTQARYASLLLEDAGYRVTIADTGSAAIQLAETCQPDAILLDVVLPDIDGFEVCRTLRQKVLVYIPVLMLTDSRTRTEDRIDAFTVGADDYLAKPFDPRELLVRVTALLRIKRIIDELHSRLTSEHQSYQALKRIALTDYLTGLYNRHYFAEVLDHEFALAARHNVPLAAIMFDIDFFRKFNTHYGHPTGDWVLQNVSRLAQSNIRQGDTLARFGGEEFMILLPMTGAGAAVEVAQRLRGALEATMWENPTCGPLNITASFGVAIFPSAGISKPEHLLACVDKALYQAKHNGRNRVEFFEHPAEPANEQPAPGPQATRSY